jgi:hypothetical protein
LPIIQKDLSTGIIRTEFDIDGAELIAIGRVITQWAYLEHGVYAVTVAIASEAGARLPDDALHTSFKRRLRAMRLTVEEYFANPDKARALRLISRIANAEQDRHKITHGLWEWDRQNPERIAASSFRPGFEFEKMFDAARINKLADEIGTISFELEYPGGMEEVFLSHADEKGHVSFASRSRRQVRELKARRDRGQSGNDPAKPQED